jgi:hypothetical protein
VQRLGIALAILFASALLSFRTVYEPDLGWHLAHGREDAAGRLVRTNVFSFTYPDYRQHYTSWLFETGAYGAWSIGGDVAVQAALAAMLAVSLLVLYAACRTAAPPDALVALAILALGVMVIEPRAIPRPHVLSFAGMAVCSWLVQRAIAARSARPLYWAPAVVAIWSNAHGECVFGAMLVGIFGAAECVAPSALTRREGVRVLGIAAACVAAAMINPYGWGLFQYLYENVSVPELLAIAELRPAYLPVYGAFFAYLALIVALFAIPVRRVALWEVVAAVAFAALGWRYLRLSPLVVFVTAPMLAARLAAAGVRWRLDARAVAITFLALAAVLPRSRGLVHPSFGTLHPPSMFSPRAAAFVRDSGLTGPLFNSNNLGGWIAWTLYPGVRTFQDSRLQAYPREHFARILEASRSQPAWDALVHDVDWAMLSSPRPNALSGAGRFPADSWATVFWDEAIEILVRRDGRYSALAESRAYRILLPDSEIAVLAPALASSDGTRLRAEAMRNRADNPDGFVAAAIACLSGDGTACADTERLGLAWPSLEDDLAIVRALRGGK